MLTQFNFVLFNLCVVIFFHNIIKLTKIIESNKFFFFFFYRDIAHQSSYNTKKVCLIHHIQLTLWKSSLTKIYTSGRFLEKQCFKRLGIRDWGTACEILTDESNYFICSKIIPCHESYIAIIVLPNLHFFIVGRIYMNHLQMAIIASQREREGGIIGRVHGVHELILKPFYLLFYWDHMMHEQQQAFYRIPRMICGQLRQLACGKAQRSCQLHSTSEVLP